jgi:serine/threonine protein kinase
MIMGYLPRGNLTELLKAQPDGRMSSHEVVAMAVQLCDGLGVAHAAGIVHRDIKPSNILIADDGRPKLADFGIAHVTQPRTERYGASDLTPMGVAVGTISYMSPEQARGERVDARSDIYSLGAVLYECLVGRRYLDFEDGNDLKNIHLVTTKEPVTPRTWRRSVPQGVADAILRALDKNPARRFRTTAELKSALMAGERVSDTGRPVIYIAAVGAVLILSGSLAWSLRPGSEGLAPVTATPRSTITVPVDAPSPTPLAAFTASPTAAVLPTSTRLAMATAMPSPTIPTSRPSSPTPLSAATLLSPSLTSPEPGTKVSGKVIFAWTWAGPALKANEGYELRIWKEGQEHFGGASPVTETILILDLAGAYAVRQSGPGRYSWSVAVVELSPYKRIGPEAPPRLLEIGEGSFSPGGPPAATPAPPPRVPTPIGPYPILPTAIQGPSAPRFPAGIGLGNVETADRVPRLFLIRCVHYLDGVLAWRPANGHNDAGFAE